MLRLRSYLQHPKDGFDYQQTEGIPRYFPSGLGIRQLATQVSDFRIANKLPRSTWEEAFRDIEVYVISRLGATSKWVEDTELSQYVAPKRVKATGGCCGAKIA